MRRRLSLFSAILIGLLMFTSNIKAGSDNKEDKPKAFDTNFIDKSVSPTADFFQYAIGNWLKNNPVPDEYSRWGSFELLAEDNYKILKTILENAASANATKGSVRQKIGDFYSVGMNNEKAEKDGAKPIEPLLQEVKSLNDLDGMTKELAKLHSYGMTPLFNFASIPDAKNSRMVIALLYQAGLGLPNRDYYLNDDASSKEIREKYLKHVAKMLYLLGDQWDAANASAQAVMNIETRLAKASMDKVELRDPYKTYNKMSLQQLKELVPDFDWSLYFASADISDPGDINVAQLEFFKELGKTVKEVSLKDWKIYLRWNIVREAGGYLSDNFVNEKFNFYGKTLNGLKVLQPKWKRVLLATNGILGEALGQLYVKEAFPPEAKERARKIVDNLLGAMGERIKNVEWMSEQTKQQALKKLEAFTVKIGYPDKWRDYSSLEIEKDSYYANIARGNQFEFKRDIAKIGKPVDRSEWGMNPQTVNAYYEPSKNEICFPAAILQPPFFNQYADDAINYGAMGAVIGHEVTHGFDDEGRQYDADGNVKEWWTSEDGKKFEERAKIVEKQYETYTPIEGTHINGAFTNGENIADLGGLTVAFTAFKKTEQYKNKEKIDGFSPEQRFFLAWAQVWKGNIRDANLKLRLQTDPHSPSKYRVLGPLSNMPEFWEAFGVKPGDKMYREKELQVKIW